MKTKLLLIALIIVSVFTMNVLAQNKDKNKSKSKEKVKIQITGLPKQMNSGETATFTVTIKNTSKKTELSTDGISFETSGDYAVSPSGVPVIILQPKESTDLTFNLTAPLEQGKSKFKITFYNNGKKVSSKTRNIRIGEGFVNNNDDEGKDNDYDDDGKGNEGKKEKENNDDGKGNEGKKEKENDDDGKGDDGSKEKNKGNEGSKEKTKENEGNKEKGNNKNKNK